MFDQQVDRQADKTRGRNLVNFLLFPLRHMFLDLIISMLMLPRLFVVVSWYFPQNISFIKTLRLLEGVGMLRGAGVGVGLLRGAGDSLTWK